VKFVLDMGSTIDHNYSDEVPISKSLEAQIFSRPLSDYLKRHNSATILDAGCGDGVHIDGFTNNNIATRDSFFVGLDISMSALSISKFRLRTNCSFIQADIGMLPFEDSRFDIAYSFGVLAYTDNPFKSFSELCRVTRSGGYVGIWIYPKTYGLAGALFLLVRKICRITGPIGSRLIADCIVPILGFLPTRSKLNLANANWRQCREVVLVNIAPEQLYFPYLSEIKEWFDKNSIRITYQDDSNPITLWGQKC